MRFQFIKGHLVRFSVRAMCRVLGVSPSGFYAWKKRPESRRKREDRRLVVEIKAIHKVNRMVYGSPRVQRELAALGLHHSRSVWLV